MSSIILGWAAGLAVFSIGAFLVSMAGMFAIQYLADRMESWWAFPAWMALGCGIFAPAFMGSASLAFYCGLTIAGAK